FFWAAFAWLATAATVARPQIAMTRRTDNLRRLEYRFVILNSSLGALSPGAPGKPTARIYYSGGKIATAVTCRATDGAINLDRWLALAQSALSVRRRPRIQGRRSATRRCRP